MRLLTLLLLLLLLLVLLHVGHRDRPTVVQVPRQTGSS